MKALNEILREFDLILHQFNITNYRKLNPPLSDNAIENKLKSLKIDSDEIFTLFKWKNGFDRIDKINYDCQIFQFGTLLSLDYVQKIVNRNNVRDSIWDDTFIPIISDDTGQYILFNNKKGRNFGRLYLYSASIMVAVNTISCYDSISTLIDTTIAAYKGGILKYDPVEDWLNCKIDEYFVLANEKNKTSEFWME